GGEFGQSRLRINLKSRFINHCFAIPYQDFDRDFVDYYDVVVKVLGSCFAKRFFYLGRPKVRGDGMKLKKVGFDRVRWGNSDMAAVDIR
ncbi:MAG: hypothetical protein HN348_26905, partial [Proteobacteria bacterium]|nr:hypothetical protein [Pseudomonadota bacterium]